ncbi:MAG TPA: indolepyruvate ferredoxin oxidoreductase family protein [Pseudonocardiaceae bacterium]|nr:indolepyruvate ferredoxin oxidoreductase family protein [Pseudonocardiaceae bacterium]
MDRPTVTLDDKYAAESGRVLLTGIQALVRLTLEQRRFDARLGLDTRAFVSGYQGSPLAGLDTAMRGAQRFLDEAGVVFRAGLNEELAATAVGGTQLLRRLPGRRHDGVVGFWYGKNPGLDRAADAIRHATVAGTAALGGAVAIIGDDPAAKSSTVPSSCEQMAQSLALPLLAPGSVAEVIEYGLHAVAMSRAAGLWTGLKIIADVADASATIELDPNHYGIPAPQRRDGAAPPPLLGPASLEAEHDLLTRRLNLARSYARDFGLNRVVFDPRRPRLGVLASGTSFAVVERALGDLGLGEGDLDALGVRLIKLGMPVPADPGALVEFAAGLEQLLVVEDKLPFLEDQLKAALYRVPDAPSVVGHRDENGRELLSARGAIGADDVARALVSRLGSDRLPASAVARLKTVAASRRSRIELPLVARAPYFCSGCPHNASTRTGPDTLVGVGIGCHTMIALDVEGRGRQIGLTQMGGEGAQWFGLAPFTNDRHFVQNLGDGTFHHSGSLAIRAAVAAGVTMTYKLLYNDAVAMTGGQRPEGRLDVASVTRLLALEGVRRIVVTTDDPRRYRGLRLDPIATVRHRDDFPVAERELAGVDGVTVLIHDDRCAADERRLRKRGKLPTPTQKVVINERVCEGCGDCGETSTCLSVRPVHTPFGRKTRIHQSSCNTDLSCLKGDCPSFLLVEPGRTARRPVPDLPVALPEPRSRLHGGDDVLLRMPGIGGTGVVTASAILQMAAHLDGLHAAGLEQIGLAQKGGPVVSDIRLSKQAVTGAVRASAAGVDVLLGFDLLGAAQPDVLATLRRGHTIAVLDTAITPTAAMVTGQASLLDDTTDTVARIAAATREEELLQVDAQGLAESLFADHMPANMVLVGAAFQHGCLPVSADALEHAIRINGAAVETTLAAFRWGRAWVVDPDAVRAALAGPVPAAVQPEGAAGAIAARATDLTGYQDAAYARRYADDVDAVMARATAQVGAAAAERIGLAYAVGLHKLMAYKDEYEVARLHLDPVEQARLAAEFGPDVRVGVLLHPPVLRALGMKRKIQLRRSAKPVFRVLRRARRLRGTRLDPFGYAHVHRVERRLIEDYRIGVHEALNHLREHTIDTVVELVELPTAITGYEAIKLARVEEFHHQLTAALQALAVSSPNEAGSIR